MTTRRDRTSWNGPLLRTLPFGRMVAAINRDSVRDQLRPLLVYMSRRTVTQRAALIL